MSDASPRSRARLRLSERFDRIGREGRWFRGVHVSIGALPNCLSLTRVGIRVQRGVKPAVIRNRIKRVFREICRKRRGDIVSGFDLVVVLRRSAQDHHLLEQDFIRVCQQLDKALKPRRQE